MKKLKIEIKWALIFSVIAVLWILLERMAGLHTTYIQYHFYFTNLFFIPAILIYVFALKDKKKNYYEGQITYKQGLISGVILSLIIALLVPFTQWITFNFVTPDFFSNIIKHTVKEGHFESFTAAKAHFNYKNYVFQGVFATLFIGIVTTAIVAFFIRTKASKS